MSDDQFTQLYLFIESFRDEMNTKLESKASQESLDRLINQVDGIVQRLDIHETELTAQGSQLQRLTYWSQRAAKKTGIPLESS